jgi:hypothetical protein
LKTSRKDIGAFANSNSVENSVPKWEKFEQSSAGEMWGRTEEDVRREGTV